MVLGSKSPRRREILGWLDIPFEIRSSNIVEKTDLINPQDIVMELSKQKGMAVYEACKKDEHFSKTFFPLVIASDTIVTLDGKHYGKPDNEQDAKEMLMELSDKTHKVFTGVHIGAQEIISGKYKETTFYCSTDVTFKKITKDILNRYINSGESLDKAGAYGIQGKALNFISKINGSYSNVVGFPIDLFIDNLKDFLGYAQDNDGQWRELIHGG